MKNQKTINLIEVHVAAFLLSFIPLVVKLVDSDLVFIVFARACFAAATLLLVLLFLKRITRLQTKKDYFFLILLGVLQAVQWFTFFKSVDVSTVAVASIALFTYPAIVALIEPFMFAEKHKLSSFVSAMAILVGIYFIVPEINFANSIVAGVLWGVLSAFLMAIIILLDRKYIQKYSSLTISFYKTIFSALALLPFLFFIEIQISMEDIGLIALLGVLFTAVPYFLFVKSLQTLKAHQVGSILTLEVVYSIIFAIIIIGETPSLDTVLGGVIILAATLYLTREANMSV